MEWAAAWIGVTTDEFHRGFFIALLVGFIFASIHLITMLVTSWGDRHATFKSLIFSILLHLFCTCGIVAISPQTFLSETPTEENISVETVLDMSDQSQPIDDIGNTPFWQQLPPMTPDEIKRSEPLVMTPQPQVLPDRQPDQQMPLTQNMLTEKSVSQPLPTAPEKIERDMSPNELELQTAPRDMNLPDAPVSERVETHSPATIKRTEISRNSIPSDANALPQKGSTEQVNPLIMTTPQANPSMNQLQAPDALVRQDDFMDQTLPKRESPLPQPAPDMTTGQQNASSTEGAPQNSTQSPRMTRTDKRATRPDLDQDVTRPRNMNQSTDTMIPGDSVSSITGNRTVTPLTSPQPQAKRSFQDAPLRGDRNSIPETYQMRNLAKRPEMARRFGGTIESEKAVEASLRWLASHQEQQGFWDGSKYGAGTVETGPDNISRENAGTKSDTGLTGLVVLAFLGAGYTQEEGPYARNVDRALMWLVSQQRQDGFLGGEASKYSAMYCHAMATFAMAEAYGMLSDQQSDLRLREPLQKAVDFIVARQNEEDGGWRYVPGQAGDMSMFGWQFMALKSADIAGIKLPLKNRQRMEQFLRDRSLGQHRGLASYRANEPPTPAMTSESLFCKQVMGVQKSPEMVSEAVGYIQQNLPRQSETNYYYWYYGTLAMYQEGGEPWDRWNRSLRDILVNTQLKNGPNAGTWEPRDPWGGYGGRLYSTALATLCLEVYYRFLPIYQSTPQKLDK